MKRNEHMNDWIGSITLLFSFVLIVLVSQDKKNSSSVNKIDTIDFSENVNIIGVSIEPQNSSNQNIDCGNTLPFLDKNNGKLVCQFKGSQTQIKLKLALEVYNNHKHNLLFTQLVSNHTNRKVYPLIS